MSSASGVKSLGAMSYGPAALAAGVGVAVPVIALGPLLSAVSAAFTSEAEAALFRAFGNAALPEEICKLIFIYLLLRRFAGVRQPMRAMAIGAFVGLGFGGVETLIYTVNNGAAVGLVRIFTAIPCHLFLGVIMAHYVWVARTSGSVVATVKSLLVPTFVHGLYNFPLMAQSAAVTAQPGGALLLTWIVLFLLAAWSRFLMARYYRQSQVSDFLAPA